MDLPSESQRPHPAQQHLHRRAPHDRILDEDHPLALKHLAERRVFRFGFLPTARGAVDERAARVTVADQPFHRRDREPVGHGVGGRLARVGNGHDDGVGVDGDRLQTGELFTEPLPRQIHAAIIHRARDVGEVDPFEEAVGLLRALGEPFNAHALAIDDERHARLERPDRLGRKADVEQGDALAGSGNEGAELGIFHRPDAKRIAGHDHPAAGVEHGDVPGAVESLRDRREQFDGVRIGGARQLVADGVHDHFGVVVAGQMVFIVGEDLSPQLHVIRQLPVEPEGKPFPLLDMRPLERLGIAAVLGAAGGITDVADGGPTGVLRHQSLVLAAVAEAKHLADAADVLDRGEQLAAVRIPDGHPGRELAAVLDVEEHPRHETRHLLRPLGRAEVAGIGAIAAWQVVDGYQPALVMQFAQSHAPEGVSKVPGGGLAVVLVHVLARRARTIRPRGRTPQPAARTCGDLRHAAVFTGVTAVAGRLCGLPSPANGTMRAQGNIRFAPLTIGP